MSASAPVAVERWPAVHGAGRAERALIVARRFGAPAGCLLAVAALIGVEILAIFNHYAMRVTADTPTFLVLIRDLALHPLKPDSVFFGTVDTRSIHASPYLQALGLIWRAVAPAGSLADPLALGRFVAVVTIPVTLFVLSMLWLYARELSGRTAAFVAVAALLVAFGPVHIAFPSDLTLNGFASTGYFPTTFATGLTLATLLTLRRSGWAWPPVSAVLTAATVTTDPLNGAVLVMLMIACACAQAPRDLNLALRIPLILTWGFLLAAQWPSFDVFGAFAESGLPVPLLLAAAVAVPIGYRRMHRHVPGVLGAAGRLLAVPISAARERALALFGAWSAAMIMLIAVYTMRHWPIGHPILQTYRLGFYWNDQRDRWLLLFAPGVCGLIGLLRLSRRGGAEMLLWFGGFFAAGLLGAVVHLATGVQLPFYYRFILLCQVPVAVGVGAFVAHHRSRLASSVVVGTLIAAFAFKLTTLLAVSDRLNYFGAPLPSIWKIGAVIPPGSGAVASDANTSYFIPVASRNRVITLGLGHADSGAEAARAEAGYRLLREVYLGSGAQAGGALQTIWRSGVRWVAVEKFTTFGPVDLRHLFAAPYNSLITRGDIDSLALYQSRLAMAGEQIYDDGEFTVYRLDPARLAHAATSAPSITATARPKVLRLLGRLARGDSVTAAVLAPELRRLGVRMVTLSVGSLGATPRLLALGRSFAGADVVSLDVSSGRWRSPCPAICRQVPDTTEMHSLGAVVHADPRFTTIVRLGAA